MINKNTKRVESQFRILLSRHHGGADGGGWYLTVIDQPSVIHILEVRLGGIGMMLNDDTRDISSDEAFSNLLSSTEAHCEGSLFVSPVHGLKQETKQHVAKIPEKHDGPDWEAFLDEVEAEVAKDGWQLDRDKKLNPHKASGRGWEKYTFTIRRWVEP